MDLERKEACSPAEPGAAAEDCFFSLIVPVYNAEQYLAQCLNSLLEQDIRDYEIICVDDGSTDGSGAMLDALGKAHQRLRVIHQANAGVAQARNAGLAAASGEYIWFIDSDDWIAPNCLGMLRSSLKEKPCDRLVVGGKIVLEDPRGGGEGSLPWQDAVVWRNLLCRGFLGTHALTFRYPEITHGEDGLFMYEVGRGQPVTRELTDVLYTYRIRAGSAETGKSVSSCRRRITSHLRVTEVLYGYYQAPGGQTPETADLVMLRLWTVLYEAASMPREATAGVAERLKALGLFPGKALPECTLKTSYLVSTDSLPGKGIDWLCCRLHTAWGFRTIQALHRIRSCLRR